MLMSMPGSGPITGPGPRPGSLLPDRVLQEHIRALVPGLPDAVFSGIRLFPARRSVHGDLSTDAALQAAAFAGLQAAQLAERLCRRLADQSCVRTAAVAGPGFVNLTLTDDALHGILPAMLRQLSSGPSSGPGPVCLTLPLASMRRDDAGFMVQYAHARCHSVLRAAAFMPGLDTLEPERLAEAADGLSATGPTRALLCRLDHGFRIVRAFEITGNNSWIRLYLQDISARFDLMWNAARDDATLRLLHPGVPTRSLANLALVRVVADVIRCSLGLLGEVAAEELR